jgi:hypothetical protein
MLRCMRTTIRLNDDLLRDAKVEAAKSGRTLTQLIEDALREKIARSRQPGRKKRVVLHTVSGSGVRPGVDLNDSAALLDIMEGLD